ncbi:MAG: T9SS type A sorting domain-containing protein [Bacteroidales bacterium]|nr:T9SS type A sorting domain-containing protein [Bacteroidales bacterium]
MKKSKLFILATTIYYCSFISIFAADIYWTGNAGDDDWFTAANWNPVQVPGYSDDVYFQNPPSGTNDVELGTGIAQCRNLFVFGSGYTFDLDYGGTLEVSEVCIFEIGNIFNNSGYIEITDNLLCYGYLDNYKQAELYVGSKITIYSSGRIDNRGSGNNYAEIIANDIDNFGIFNNEDMSEVTITNRMNNYSQFTNYNKAVLEIGGYLFNTGDFTNEKHSEMKVIATLENIGVFTCEDHSTLDGDNNLLILNYGNFYNINHAEVISVMEIENYQLIENDNYFETNDLWLYFKADIQNTANFNVVFTLENDGEIENSGSFYVGDIFDNTVNGVVNNTGCFEVAGNMSNSGSYVGSLLNHASIFGYGTYTYNRNTGGTGNYGEYEGWHYISTPVLGMENHHMFDYWINDWDEGQNFWYDFSPGGTPCTTSPPILFEVMKGYSIKRDLNYQCGHINPGTGEVIEFTGTMNDVASEAWSIEVSGSDFEPGDPNSMNNWNLVGNPYPSAIDANLIVFPPEIDNAIYYYNDLTLTYESFVGGVGQPFIPVAQGFFIHVNTFGTFDFNLDNSVKTCTGSDDWYKNDIANLLTVTVESSRKIDKTYIRFKEGASELFDKKWDAYKLASGVKGVPQVYTQTANARFSINTTDFNKKANLIVQAGNTDIHKLSFSGVEDFEIVYLQDKLENKIIDLKHTEHYNFFSNEENTGDRFVLHFSEYAGDLISDGFIIYGQGNTVYVNNVNNLTGSFSVINLLGQTITTRELTGGLNSVQPMNGSGMYVVQVQAANKKLCGKVYIK